MNKEFTELVISMREAQREYFALEDKDGVGVTGHHFRLVSQRRKAAEQKVDAWIQRYMAERVQLDLWTRSAKGSEGPGVYNATRDEEVEQRR